MAVACWRAYFSFVGLECSEVSGRLAGLNGFREELVDTAVGAVCCENLDSLGARSHRENLDHCVVGRGAVAVVVRKRVRCQASVGRGW